MTNLSLPHVLSRPPHETTTRAAPSRLTSRIRVALMTILITAFVLRLTLLVLGGMADTSRATMPDTGRYERLANNLVTHGQFIHSDQTTGLVHVPLQAYRDQLGTLERVSPGNAPVTQEPTGWVYETFRTPGYAVYLAGFQAVLGTTDAARIAAIVGQIILGCISVWLVWRIALRMTQSPVGSLIAAGIVAVHPALLLQDNLLLSETLFTTLLLASVWLTFPVDGRPTYRRAALAGLCIGLSALVRPITIMLAPSLAFWLFFVGLLPAASGARRRHFAAAAVLAFVSALPMAGWMARNAEIGLGWRLSSVPQVNAWFYTAAHIDIAEAGGDLFNDWPAAVERQMATLQATVDERIASGEVIGESFDVFDVSKALAMERIAASPDTYGKLFARSVIKFSLDHSMGGMSKLLGYQWQPTGFGSQLLSGQLGAIPWSPGLVVALTWTGFNALIMLLSGIGLVVLIIRRRYGAMLLLLGVMTYFILATQTNGLERFRVPVIGIQAVLVAGLLSQRLTTEVTEDAEG